MGSFFIKIMGIGKNNSVYVNNPAVETAGYPYHVPNGTD